MNALNSHGGSTTALLVIDVQESFRARRYWSDVDVPKFLTAVQHLIDAAVSAKTPVVQILHEEPDGPFSVASGMVRTLEPLRIRPDAIVRKTRHSAFVGTDLGIWLTRNRIARVIVCGIRTEQCCETTTRHASDLGYAVDFVTEATLTFAMADSWGRGYTSEEIKERTALVLSDRFARIRTSDDVAAELLAEVAPIPA